ncbi:hypothetical protein QBC34DRAFT_495785 [Podospora aff. communis PSN243]|uniref:AA1-like domain-containing protein n=1 Tax=Podospora aff. communis PSN243 TaxID=3040156 RepID=A0AAV9GKK3_9PEZI|nr:hypothetical protein QBC34DRAFT_495785 [Podospora aff. communis PSN243]
MRAAVSFISLLCGVALALGGADSYAADECAASSGEHSFWRIDNLVLKVYDWDNGGTTGTFGFKSYYSATNKTVDCIAQDVDLAKLADGPWLTCNTPGSEFRFDFTEISLTMRETWTCPESPGASATGLIMLHGCLDNNTEKGIESDCHLMELEMAADVTPSGGHHHG